MLGHVTFRLFSVHTNFLTWSYEKEGLYEAHLPSFFLFLLLFSTLQPYLMGKKKNLPRRVVVSLLGLPVLSL